MNNFSLIFLCVLINETFCSSSILKEKKNASPPLEDGKSQKRRSTTSENISIVTNRLELLKLSENDNYDKNNSKSSRVNKIKEQSESTLPKNVSNAIVPYTGAKYDKKIKPITDNPTNKTRRQSEITSSNVSKSIVPYTGVEKDKKMKSKIDYSPINEAIGQSEMTPSNVSNTIVPYTSVKKNKKMKSIIVKIEPRKNSSATNESREKSPSTLRSEELARDKKFVDEMIELFTVAKDEMTGKSEAKRGNSVKNEEPLKKKPETRLPDPQKPKTVDSKNKGVRKENCSQMKDVPRPKKSNMGRSQDDSKTKPINFAEEPSSSSSRFKPRSHAQRASYILYKHLVKNANLPLIDKVSDDESDERLKDVVITHPHPGAARDIFFKDRLDSYIKDYEYALQHKNSSKLKKERARKKRICETNSMRFTTKLCDMIRYFYHWRGQTDPVCVNATVGDHKTLEKVALCKMEWPRDNSEKVFLTSPITGQILYVGSDARKPITVPHDIIIAIFDGLGEFEYFIARLEERYEHAKKIANTSKIYKVFPANIITANASVDLLHELTKSDLTVIEEGVLVKYNDCIATLSSTTGMSFKEVATALIEIGTLEYHAQSEFNIEDKIKRLAEVKLEMIDMFDKKFSSGNSDKKMLEMMKNMMFGPNVYGFYM